MLSLSSADALGAPAQDKKSSGQTPLNTRAWNVHWPFSWIASTALVISLLSLVPLGFVLWVTFQTGWATASALIFRPRVGELLLNTGLLVALTVPICAVLAVALA